jgi:hypothetical protein
MFQGMNVFILFPTVSDALKNGEKDLMRKQPVVRIAARFIWKTVKDAAGESP